MPPVDSWLIKMFNRWSRLCIGFGGQASEVIKISYILHMFFRSVLILMVCLVFACGGSKDEPINFVIFIADDVSWNDLGVYGDPVASSPFIDSLARDGLVFNNMFLTTSSCSPSRASILTGRYPHNTGAPELHMPLPENMITIG